MNLFDCRSERSTHQLYKAAGVGCVTHVYQFDRVKAIRYQRLAEITSETDHCSFTHNPRMGTSG